MSWNNKVIYVSIIKGNLLIVFRSLVGAELAFYMSISYFVSRSWAQRSNSEGIRNSLRLILFFRLARVLSRKDRRCFTRIFACRGLISCSRCRAWRARRYSDLCRHFWLHEGTLRLIQSLISLVGRLSLQCLREGRFPNLKAKICLASKINLCPCCCHVDLIFFSVLWWCQELFRELLASEC